MCLFSTVIPSCSGAQKCKFASRSIRSLPQSRPPPLPGPYIRNGFQMLWGWNTRYRTFLSLYQKLFHCVCVCMWDVLFPFFFVEELYQKSILSTSLCLSRQGRRHTRAPRYATTRKVQKAQKSMLMFYSIQGFSVRFELVGGG